MKHLILLCLSAIVITGCGLNKQARQVEALEKCTYEISSADSIFIAGRDVSRLINSNEINLSSIPGLAIAFLNKDIPLKARLNLKIKNPTSAVAAINQFEYIVLVKGQELANGFVNQKVSVGPGDSTTVPVNVNANIYQFLSNDKTMQEIADFIRGGRNGETEKKGILTLKIKPTIEVGNTLFKYPGYITIDKEVSSKILF